MDRAALAAHLALELSARPSPAGGEGPLATWTARWLEEHGATGVRVQDLGDGRANLLVGPPTGPELAFYGHLDTSLTGDPAVDHHLTGREGPPPAPWEAGGVLWGPGMAVAKAPTAAALVTLLGLQERFGSRVGALIAAGGTHRAVPPAPARPTGAPPPPPGGGVIMATGVRAALAAGFRPGAVLSAKGGPPGPLYEEPGAMYLAVTVAGPFGAAAFGGSPDGDLIGAPAAVGPLVAAIARWRRRFLTACAQRAGQLAGQVALGAIEAGLPAKPDLFPTTARCYLYVVALPAGQDQSGGPFPEQSPAAVAASLQAQLEEDGMAAAVEVYGWLPGGVTDPAHPLAVAVGRAWEDVIGSPPVRGWQGSTDGGLLRAEGIATVRAGPPYISHDDPRVEGARVADLARMAEVWERAATAYLDR